MKDFDFVASVASDILSNILSNFEPKFEKINEFKAD